MSKFSYMEAVNYGWSTFQKNIPFFIVLTLINLGLSAISFTFSGQLEKNSSAQWQLSILQNIIGLFLSVGTTKILLDFVDKGRGDLNDLYKQYRLFLNYFFATIIYTVVVIAGLLLLIVPGVYFALRFSQYSYFIIDKKARPLEALKLSSLATKGVKWNLAVFALIIVALNVLGALALLVGLLATVPTSMLAAAYVYRKLERSMEVAQTTAPQPPLPATTETI